MTAITWTGKQVFSSLSSGIKFLAIFGALNFLSCPHSVKHCSFLEEKFVEALRKLRVSTKCPYQKISYFGILLFGILRNASRHIIAINPLVNI